MKSVARNRENLRFFFDLNFKKSTYTDKGKNYIFVNRQK